MTPKSRWVTMAEASRISGYSPFKILKLHEEGKIVGELAQVGHKLRKWFFDPETLPVRTNGGRVPQRKEKPRKPSFELDVVDGEYLPDHLPIVSQQITNDPSQLNALLKLIEMGEVDINVNINLNVKVNHAETSDFNNRHR